ncbi:MAG: protein phosphatase CheZ [Nitrospira sp.]|nr:protein phosphatase CheZ [Nitrospira sp.]
MNKREHKLYEELGDLARFVENATKAISEAGSQIISSSQQLPTASSHLSDLNKMTEEGTLEVMRLTELIQDEHSRIGKELRTVIEVLQTMDCTKLAERLNNINTVVAQEGKYLTDIMTALSFQDLVAQRVKKLVSILDEVQHKLMELVVVFGLQQNGETVVKDGAAGHLLKQLEESKTTAMKQKVADDILAQFGFK